jgi:hypothetical protein
MRCVKHTLAIACILAALPAAGFIFGFVSPASSATYTFVSSSYKSYNTGSAALPTGTQVGDLWLFLHSDYYDSDEATSGFTELSPVQGVATAYIADWYKIPASLGADIPLPFYAAGTVISMRKSTGTISVVGSNFTTSASAASLTCTGIAGTGTLILIATHQSAGDKNVATPAGFSLLHKTSPIWLGGQYQFVSVFRKANDGSGVTATLDSAASFKLSLTLLN